MLCGVVAALLVASSDAFSVVGRAPRATPRASVSAADLKTAAGGVDECVVDAESAAEIAACSDTAEPSGAARRPGDAPVTFVIESEDQEECVVDAENPDELAACFDTTLGTTYEELRRSAESAAELVDIPDVAPAPFAARSRDEQECLVSAENPTEASACFDTTVGTTVEECITDAENAVEIDDCKA